MEEEIEGLKVLRTWIYPSHSKSFAKRLFNYFSFVFSSMLFGIFKLGKHDVLICETPPLFLGLSAYVLSRLKGAKMFLYVSDLWPASAVDLGMLKNKMLIKNRIQNPKNSLMQNSISHCRFMYMPAFWIINKKCLIFIWIIIFFYKFFVKHK